MDPLVVWPIAITVVGFFGYCFGWYSHPRHRKDCAECAAELRRVNAAKAEASHNLSHRGFEAPGMPYPTQDIYECRDAKCPRNAEVRKHRS